MAARDKGDATRAKETYGTVDALLTLGLGRGRERCTALADCEQRSTSTCLELLGLLQ